MSHANMPPQLRDGNPVRRWRTHRGLSRRELAMAADVDVSAVVAVEDGSSRRMPARLRGFFERMGEDVAAMEREYAVWRAQVGAHVIAAVQTGQTLTPPDERGDGDAGPQAS